MNTTTPIHDSAAEQGLLGALILAPHVLTDILETLIPTDFYQPAHQIIYETITDLWGDGNSIDALILAGKLDRANNLDRVGGAPYIHTLMTSTPTASNAPHYAKIIAEKAVLRRLAEAGEKVTFLAHNGATDTEIDTLVDQAQQEVHNVTRDKESSDYEILADLIQPTMEELDDIASAGGLSKGVPTGFHDLDTLTNGLHGGQMIIIAARPGVGKSTIGLDFMRSASIKHGKASIIFSLEMSKPEIVMRLLSAETNIKLSDMRAGKMSDTQWATLSDRATQINDAPLYIDDSATLTMTEIRSKARRLHQRQPLGLIVIDYLQLMSSGKKVESRQQEVSEFSRQLKLLAKELDVPVIAISQLNRGPEQRDDKRPQLSDLRESGSLEQDADMVMLIYRPDSQDKEDARAGEADIILAKHRGGAIDTVTVAHQLHYSKFVNMAR